MQICILCYWKNLHFGGFTICKKLVQQIKGRKVLAEKKVPFFESRKHYFPPNLNLEQASSEDTTRLQNSF